MTDPSPELDTATADVLQALVENHAQFRNFLRKRLADPDAADDILQQAFVKAVEKQGDIREGESAVAWMYRVLRNALIDHYRARAGEKLKNAGFLQELVTAGDDRSPAADELRAEVCACMGRLLPAMRPAYADLLRRVDLEGQDVADVAESLGVTRNNLDVRLHRARQALRKGLEASCGTCTTPGCLDCTCGADTPVHNHR